MILTIDQGTTNTKAVLLGRDGRVVARASAGVALHLPQPGFVEQDPEALWGSVRAVIAEVLGQAEGRTIAGVTISNQRETALVWDRKTGEPLAPAMSWQCRRSAARCKQFEAETKTIRERSGLPLDPLLSATKWAWWLEASAGRQADDVCFGTVDSWLVWKLTGGAVHGCDHTNASRTGLMNLASGAWDTELLQLFGVPLAALPEIRTSSGSFGVCHGVEGFKDAPIVAAIGDSHAALVAHGGMAKATYGTGSSLMVAVEIVPKKAGGLAATIAWSTPQQTVYALEGNISMAGAAVQWVGEFLGLAHPVEDALALAATVPDAGGVVLVPAMVGLGAPYWRTEARGLICGLERGSSRAQLARAAVDSIAFQVRDVFEAVCAATGSRPRELHADGGATRNKALMQMQADLLEVPVVRSACEDLSALGAGCLGGLALGWWKSVDEFAALGEAATVFTPGHCMETQYAAWQAAVDRTLQEVAR